LNPGFRRSGVFVRCVHLLRDSLNHSCILLIVGVWGYSKISTAHPGLNPRCIGGPFPRPTPPARRWSRGRAFSPASARPKVFLAKVAASMKPGMIPLGCCQKTQSPSETPNQGVKYGSLLSTRFESKCLRGLPPMPQIPFVQLPFQKLSPPSRNPSCGFSLCTAQFF